MREILHKIKLLRFTLRLILKHVFINSLTSTRRADQHRHAVHIHVGNADKDVRARNQNILGFSVQPVRFPGGVRRYRGDDRHQEHSCEFETVAC